jgi:uncharacterized membrane protein required for colicin V production
MPDISGWGEMENRGAVERPWRSAFERMTAVLPSLEPVRRYEDFMRDLGAALAILGACFVVLLVVATIDTWLGVGLLDTFGRGWGSIFGTLLAIPVLLVLVTLVYVAFVNVPACLLRLLRRITGA